ncbi:MAG TPA: hypothetical protein VGB15_18260 [Longimicrobium sp.]|jgi:hypothetical protein
MDQAGSITADGLKARIFAGEGSGEGFDGFRREDPAGLRAMFEPTIPAGAREVHAFVSTRRDVTALTGTPMLGVDETLAELKARGHAPVLRTAFVAASSVFIVFAGVDGIPFACLSVPRHEEGLIGDDGEPVVPTR